MWQMWAAIAGVAAFNFLCMLALYAEIDAMRRRLDRESDIANAGGEFRRDSDVNCTLLLGAKSGEGQWAKYYG